jgi:hypothetical protein
MGRAVSREGCPYVGQASWQLDRTCSQPLRAALAMIGPVDFEDRLSQTAQAA